MDEDLLKHIEEYLTNKSFCPIGLLTCQDFLIKKDKLKEHLIKFHPKRIIQNPATLKIYINQSNIRTYIIFTFDEIFVLCTTVCLKSKKLTYQVRHEGDKYKAHAFKYTLKVKKKLYVQPITSKFHDDLTVKLDLNDLENFLSFTLTIHSLAGCNKCKKKMTNKLLCTNCEPNKRLCENYPRGCVYKDTDIKCKKHEQNFCKYKTICPRCFEAEISLVEHFVSKHNDVICSVGSFWRAKENINKQGVILKNKNEDVKIVCLYRLYESNFDIQVCSDLVSEAVVNYGCYITIINPKNGENRSFSVSKSCGKVCDWELNLKKYDFMIWNTEFEVSVDVCDPEYKRYLEYVV